jgi:hypothetical protein
MTGESGMAGGGGTAGVRPDRAPSAGGSAFVEEALDDPIVRLVMRRDGITAADVREAIRRARSKVDARLPVRARTRASRSGAPPRLPR